MHIQAIHHIAIIATDYLASKHFYTKILGFQIIQEVYREQRNSYKCDLSVNGLYQIELFSFPEVALRASRPEAAGLRHLAFAVANVQEWHKKIVDNGGYCEQIRVDDYTGKHFFFFQDPSGQPLEMYEQ